MHIDIMVCSKDRPTELALLLQSLRTQTHKEWDLFIMDDGSGLSYTNHHFISSMINRIKLEGHQVIYWRNDIRYGVTKLRQKVVDRILEEGKGEAILRLDDDNILNPDYIERLIKVLEKGFDIASGLVPHMAIPFIKRETRFVKPFIADITLNEDGSIKNFGDDCGCEYLEKEIIPSPHFRSMALIRKKVHEKIKYEDNLGFCSFREEEFFSFKAIIEGFKIGVDTGAIGYHLQTPSGGERTPEFQNNLGYNHNRLNEFTKELFKTHGDFINKYKENFKGGPNGEDIPKL
jgi:glycosyltransferase involved in cell wall biosynthesis